MSGYVDNSSPKLDFKWLEQHSFGFREWVKATNERKESERTYDKYKTQQEIKNG